MLRHLRALWQDNSARFSAIREWALAREGVLLTGIGVVVGLLGALILTRLMASLLFGVTSTDFVTYLGVPALLAGGNLCHLDSRSARYAGRSHQSSPLRVSPAAKNDRCRC